ncbi:MAG TPA: SBBP repeat-containing protein [Candidatus Acidoferrum sp.]|nr:SBBP repeat-containing protein [Candidatus Acidoferrum sp.]
MTKRREGLLGIGATLISILSVVSTTAAPIHNEPLGRIPALIRPQFPTDGRVSPFSGAEPRTSSPNTPSHAYGRLSRAFEMNRGQTDGQVRFLSRGSGYTLFLTSTEAVFVLSKREARAKRDRVPLVKPEPARREKVTRTVLRMELVGAKPEPQAMGRDELPGKINYFIGNDPAKWRTNVPLFAKVEYRDVYPGVNLVYYGNPQHQLEYDFVVAPGADPSVIRLAFRGAESLEVDANGDLILQTRGGEFRLQKPLVYQDINGRRTEISGGYVIQDEDRVGFKVAAYDPTEPLVIDPVLVYSTFLGGVDFDAGGSLTVDAAGNAYVTGRSASLNFPTAPGALNAALSGENDAFVTKLNAAGSLVYSTFLGGSGDESGNGIGVDATGSAYVTGLTGSADFPTTPGALPATLKGEVGAFVAKLDATGSALVYSTFLSGSGGEVGFGIAVDATGNAYVTGATGSADFPTTPGALDTTHNGVSDVFVTKLNASGSALVYSTFLGGSDNDGGSGIAVDSAGNAYVTGATASADFPTSSGAFDPTWNGNPLVEPFDAFVAKLNASGSALVYSTYLGGSDFEGGSAIAVDTSGSAYVTGFTASTDFPTTATAFRSTFRGGDGDAFVTKLNATGSALVYSTYLGGSGVEAGRGIAVDSAGNVYVTGETDSADFPTVNPIQATLIGGSTVFVSTFNAAGTALVYSTYLGGSLVDGGNGIALDATGNVYVAGTASSADFPTVNPSQPVLGGSVDAFVARVNPFGPSVNTPSGSQVTVPLGSGASVSFPSISSQGNSAATTSSTGPTPPSGFSLGSPPTYYDLTTTASFAGLVTFCVRYDPAQFVDPSMLHLLHFEGSVWVDVTTSTDTVNNVICGQVSSFSPFVITESAVLRVGIDIKPHSFPNSINLGSNGTVPVAILSTATFDARTVNPLTVTLASAPVKLKGKGTPMASFEDVNGDGRLDLVVHVETEALQMGETDSTAVLEGQTFTGRTIRGTDSVRIVP